MSTSTDDRVVNGSRNPVGSPAEPVGLEGYPRSAGDLGDTGDRKKHVHRGSSGGTAAVRDPLSELMATFADDGADVALKETALGHTLREGGGGSGESIDRLSANRPSVCCFTVTDRAPSFICKLCIRTPDALLVVVNQSTRRSLLLCDAAFFCLLGVALLFTKKRAR